MIYDRLLEVDEFFSYNDVLDCLESWTEGAEDYLCDSCIKNPDRNIPHFIEIFNNMLSSQKLNSFLDAYDIKVNISPHHDNYC